jgi:hypothetical protein
MDRVNINAIRLNTRPDLLNQQVLLVEEKRRKGNQGKKHHTTVPKYNFPRGDLIQEQFINN